MNLNYITSPPITVPVSVLKAISLFAADTSDIRHEYLRSVHVEAFGREGRLVATDGKVMGIWRQQLDEDVLEPTAITIPLDAIRAVLRGAKRDNVNIYTDRLESPDHIVPYTPINDAYINYRKACPSTVSGELAHYDLALLCLFEQAAVALTGGAKKNEYDRSFARIHHNGTNCAVVTLSRHPQFLGFLMPFYFDNKEPLDLWGHLPLGEELTEETT